MSDFSQSAKHCRGFTLIEMLTVVFLIGIAVGGVSVFITQDGPEKRTNEAVEKFVVICEHVSELSILSGEPVGLLLEPPEWQEDPLEAGWRYSWKRRVNVENAWVWMDLTDVASVELEKQFRLRVTLDEIEWEYENSPKVKEPIVAFYPSGEVTPFEIEFEHDDVPGEKETVYVDVWGRVVWKERQEEKEREEEFK